VSRGVLAGALVVLLLGAVIAALLLRPAEQGARNAPAAAKRAPMEFTREGAADKITAAVERVVRPGRAQVAICERNGARWACILADAPKRYYELDRGLVIDDFPAIRDGGFDTLPSHLARTTSSIYRSVAKRAMGYDRSRGDRIIVALCPRDEWPQLRLSWPNPKQE